MCLVLALLAAAGFGPPSQAATDVTPGTFAQVSTGVAFIKTFNCGGRATGQGTGFLVGSSVVMTARHVLQGSCSARVTIAGKRYKGGRWVYWSGSRSTGFAEDLATLKLDRAAPGHVFRVRSTSPPAGTNLGMIGYPLGNRLSLNQGKIIWRGKRAGAPLLAVQMLGAEGASGAPFIDGRGRVVGILQIGLGAADILGQRTAGVLMGLDLVRWWGPRARLDLCRAYPKGGIAGCQRQDTPAPPTDPAPPSNPPPPPPPATLSVTECWAAATDSLDPAQKVFSLAAIQQKLYFNLRYNRTSTIADTVSLSYRLIRPDGTVFSSDTFDNSGQRYTGAGVWYELKGPGELAPQGGFWKAEGRLNNGPPCTYEFKVERLLNPLELTVSKTQFDPYFTFSITVGWRLLQEIESTGRLELRLVTPNGNTYSTSTVFPILGSSTAFLSTPFCSRFSTVDTCQYGTYRVDVVRDGLVVGSVTLTGVKP